MVAYRKRQRVEHGASVDQTGGKSGPRGERNGVRAVAPRAGVLHNLAGTAARGEGNQSTRNCRSDVSRR